MIEQEEDVVGQKKKEEHIFLVVQRETEEQVVCYTVGFQGEEDPEEDQEVEE